MSIEAEGDFLLIEDSLCLYSHPSINFAGDDIHVRTTT